MLNRASRLTTKQFNEVMKNGKVVHSTFFIGRIHTKADSKGLAAVAPVKIAKTAVLRNRTRRRIYTAVRPLFAEVSVNAQVLLMAKSSFIETSDTAAVRADLKNLFVKAGLLR